MTPSLERRIDSIRLHNLLSFRDTTLELRNLNVVIGPNGSGKSNLLMALEILRGTRGDFREAVRSAGGVELRWLGSSTIEETTVAVSANVGGDDFGAPEPLLYSICFSPERASVIQESMKSSVEDDGYVFFRASGFIYAVDQDDPDKLYFSKSEMKDLSPILVPPAKAALSELRDAKRYVSLTLFGADIESIRTVSSTSWGPGTAARAQQSVLKDETRLLGDGSNLALVLNNLASSGLHDKIDDYLSRFLTSYKRLTFRIEGGAIRMFLSEHGISEPIPASRFSDGTIAFLRLIALLYEPAIPMILAIEEPEAGLHPDAIRLVAGMIRDASERKQILITTHSPELVDALSDDPESIVVCEKDPEDGTQFRRLSAGDLEEWLERYTLGELWKKGEIGGTRW